MFATPVQILVSCAFAGAPAPSGTGVGNGHPGLAAAVVDVRKADPDQVFNVTCCGKQEAAERVAVGTNIPELQFVVGTRFFVREDFAASAAEAEGVPLRFASGTGVFDTRGEAMDALATECESMVAGARLVLRYYSKPHYYVAGMPFTDLAEAREAQKVVLAADPGPAARPAGSPQPSPGERIAIARARFRAMRAAVTDFVLERIVPGPQG